VEVCVKYVVLFCSIMIATSPAHLGAETPSRDEVLKDFLQNYLEISTQNDDRSTKYLYAFVDLDGDGLDEAIVYVTDQEWCGSGGCTTLILAPEGSWFRVITKITITHPPIRILPIKTNGWFDISVWVQGEGIQPGYEAELCFDGETYPTNPSVPPAKRLKKNQERKGKAVIALPY
jgi:hypothetical protein